MEERGVPFRYREYREDRLTASELRELFVMLGVGPKQVLRKGDRAFKELELTGEEGDDVLTELMAAHPTLLQRPIGVLDGHAAVGRPPEALVELVR